MTTSYTARVVSPDGSSVLAVITNFVDADGPALAYSLAVGKVGALRLTVPAWVDPGLFPLDARIGVWRSIDGRPPELDGQTVYLVRQWQYDDVSTTITAYSANHLLTRRIIAYYAGSSYSSQALSPAGNLIKTVVSQNMLGGISAADRIGAETQADISAYLSAQPNLGDGVNLVAQIAWRSLFDVVTEMMDATTFAGAYVAADIVAPTESTLELRTYATQRGVDHTASSGDPVILSPETGSLENCRLIVDRSQEVTVAIAAGQGEQSARLTASAIDTTRIADSPLNRIEQFGDYSNLSDTAALQDVADAMVRAGRPKISFSADLVETPGATRGIHYDLGDMLTARFRGQQYDVRLDAIQVSLSGGKQKSAAALRSVS